MSATKAYKKLNPYLRPNRVEARVTNDELRTILEKSALYSGGNLSEFLRDAVLNYKPIIKKAVGK